MDIVERQKRAFFGQQFSYHLEKYMKTGKTQKDFCNAAGVSKNIVTAWKRGERFPRDAQMLKICEVFGIDQRAFYPLFPAEVDLIDNSVTKARSDQLRKYADEKGLREKWYQYFMSQRRFLRRFPFHSESIYITVPEEEQFDPVRFQIEDDNGRRTMMTESDIDFLIEIQNRTDAQIDYLMYRERLKNNRKRIEAEVDFCLKNYDLDREEVLKRLFSFDLTKADHEVTIQDVWRMIDLMAREKGIMPHFTAEELKRPPDDPEQVKKAAEWLKRNGIPEDQIDDLVRQAEQLRREDNQRIIEQYRDAGLLIENDKETEV